MFMKLKGTRFDELSFACNWFIIIRIINKIHHLAYVHHMINTFMT